MVEINDDAEEQPPNLKVSYTFQDRKGVHQSVPLTLATLWKDLEFF